MLGGKDEVTAGSHYIEKKKKKQKQKGKKKRDKKKTMLGCRRDPLSRGGGGQIIDSLDGHGDVSS